MQDSLNWVQCKDCNCTFLKNDFHLHKRLDDLCDSACDKNHIYFLNGVLYGCPKTNSAKDDVLLPEMNDLLLLHPQTMKNLNLVKGGLLLINTTLGQLILRSWPCLSVQESSFLLQPSHLFKHYMKCQFALNIFKDTVGIAKKVILDSADYRDCMSSGVFKSFLKKELENIYIREKQIFHLCYLGYPFSVTVKRIDSTFPVDRKKPSKNKEKLLKDVCSKLFQLDVNPNNTSLFDNSKSGKLDITPLKTSKKFQSSTPISTTKNLTVIPDSVFKPAVDLKLREDILSKDIFYQISSHTSIFVQKPKVPNEECLVSFNDIGGLSKEIKEIRSFINFSNEGLNKGILIVGPSGCGKTMLTQAIQNEEDVYACMLKPCMFTGDRTENVELHRVFKEVEENSSCILLIDDIDQFSARFQSPFVSQKDTSMEQISSVIYDLMNRSGDVLMFATARSEALVPEALRKHNLLDKEIQLSVPTLEGRKEILLKILKTFKNDLSSDETLRICQKAHGFTGRDLKRLCQKAWLYSASNSEMENDCKISFKYIEESLHDIKPESMAEFRFESPNVRWSDIGGMEKVKNSIIEMVDWPLKHAEKLKKFKITPSRGILMYGPPGCCKTMIAKALVTESELNFISIKGPQLFSKYVGESEKAVSDLFKRARAAAPCVLFFDEIDSLASARGSTSRNSNVADRVLTQLLVEIDGVDILKGVCIIAATNRPDLIDPSLLRPGRFDQMIYVPLPDLQTRTEVFKVKLSKMPVSSDVDLSYLAKVTENYTGAEIADICQEAAMMALEQDLTSLNSVVSMTNLLSVLEIMVPRTKKEMIQFYEKYKNKHVL